MPDDVILRRVLWAFFEVWRNATGEERQICNRWARTQFQNRFGEDFRQSKLHDFDKFSN
jgi:hypothetical protein